MPSQTSVTVRLTIAVSAALLLAGCAGTAPAAPAPAASAPAASAPAAPAPDGAVSSALDVIGLLDGTSLVSFTTADTNPTGERAITGLDGDARVIGIDHRVKTGDLLGVGDKGGVYTLADDGSATKIGTLTVPLEGTRFGVDVNPAADALRIVSDTGQNLRQPLAMTPLAATAADTKLTNPATAPATGTVPAPGVTAAAYTNDDADTTSGTTLFVLDTTAGRLAIQSPANAGTLAPVGALGGTIAPATGFDIHSTLTGDRASGVTAWANLETGGTRNLHQVDLLTGGLQKLGALPAGVTDIALPLGQG